MRLRSGLVVDRAEGSSTGDLSMEDENYSTRAERGTPSTPPTSSFNTNDHPRSSVSPVAEEESTPARDDTPRVETGETSHAPDTQQRANPYQTPALALAHQQLQTPGTPTPGNSGYENGPSRVIFPQFQVATLQTPPQTDAMRRFTSGPQPWSPQTPTDVESHRRKLSDDFPGIQEYPRDRNFPDKLETDLTKLEQGQEEEEDTEEERRKRKRPKREKRPPGSPSRGRGKDRKDRDRGRGGKNVAA